jgi:hypothetical protein
MILEDTGLVLRICARYLLGFAAIGALFVLLCATGAFIVLNALNESRDNLALLLRFSNFGWVCVFALGCWIGIRLRAFFNHRSITSQHARTLA